MTKIYGCSDDLIEFEGDFQGEVSEYGTDDQEHGVLLLCSDGTWIEAKYGKLGKAIWGMTILKQGELFDRIDLCTDEDQDPYSDIVYLKEGIKSVMAVKKWEWVK